MTFNLESTGMITEATTCIYFIIKYRQVHQNPKCFSITKSTNLDIVFKPLYKEQKKIFMDKWSFSQLVVYWCRLFSHITIFLCIQIVSLWQKNNKLFIFSDFLNITFCLIWKTFLSLFYQHFTSSTLKIGFPANDIGIIKINGMNGNRSLFCFIRCMVH